MPEALRDGAIVRLKNVKFGGAIELDHRIQTAVLSDFNGCEYQQWRASQDLKGLWRFRNVATGLYLGQDAGKLANGVTVGTSFEFPWKVKEVDSGNDQSPIVLHVPNTKKVLDADDQGQLPAVRLQLCAAQAMDCQFWSVDQDAEPSPPCQPGGAYKIVDTRTGSVAHLEENGNVSGFRYNEGRNQVWEAIQYDGTAPSSNLWYFKNLLNSLYLGIRDEDEAKHGTRVVGTSSPFLWNVVPSNRAPNEFHFSIPFTQMNMDICGHKPDPGATVHLDPHRTDGNCWKFERQSLTVGDGDPPVAFRYIQDLILSKASSDECKSG